MNKKEQKILIEFPMALDQAIIDRFGEEVEPTTFFDFFGSMSYVTNFKAEGELKTRIDDFIAGYIKGNLELRERLENV